MLSTCPSCLTQVLHDDHLKEVRCTECGTIFPTVLQFGEEDDIAGEHYKEENSHKASVFESKSEENNSEDLFKESKLAFDEICDFGENLTSNEKPLEEPAPIFQERESPVEEEKISSSPKIESREMRLITTVDSLQDFVIEAYVDTVSSVCELKEELTSPLDSALDAIWNEAKLKGANGIISLRIHLYGSPPKVLLTGTAIKYSKKVT